MTGKPVRIKNPGDAVRDGIGWVPEDRKLHGLVLKMDVKSNMTLAILRRISSLVGRIRRVGRERFPRSTSRHCRSRRPSLSQTVR